jgi:hypothetical protein
VINRSAWLIAVLGRPHPPVLCLFSSVVSLAPMSCPLIGPRNEVRPDSLMYQTYMAKVTSVLPGIRYQMGWAVCRKLSLKPPLLHSRSASLSLVVSLTLSPWAPFPVHDAWEKGHIRILVLGYDSSRTMVCHRRIGVCGLLTQLTKPMCSTNWTHVYRNRMPHRPFYAKLFLLCCCPRSCSFCQASVWYPGCLRFPEDPICWC